MKTWVIIVSDVYDYEEYRGNPQVFLDKKKAEENFREIVDDYRSDNENDDWEEVDGQNMYESYPSGEFSRAHYAVYLYEVEAE